MGFSKSLSVFFALTCISFNSFSEEAKVACSVDDGGTTYTLTFCYEVAEEEGSGDGSLYGCEKGDVQLSVGDEEISLTGGTLDGNASDGETKAEGSEMKNGESTYSFSFLHNFFDSEAGEFSLSKNGEEIATGNGSAVNCKVL